MSYLSEAHAEWHAVHGKYACCPLDCGAGEPIVDYCGVEGCEGVTIQYPGQEAHTEPCTASPEAHAEARARWAAEAAAWEAKRAAEAAAWDPWAGQSASVIGYADPPF